MSREYNVFVEFCSTTSGSDLDKYPDNRIGMSFDATDNSIDDMLRQFAIFITAIGYIIPDGKRFGLVDDNEF